MAYFTSKSGKLVRCYDGTFCSGTEKAELTDPRFIEKARRNDDFVEIIEAPVVVKKVSKKRVSKKLTIPQLKTELKALGLKIGGTKPELQKRLAEAQ
jgi:hypothetical protein